MIPLDATMLVLARWMPFSPNRISPWTGKRWTPSVNVKQLMCRKKLRRDNEEPISNTYILRHSDGDNLIGHRLNSRERSQRIDSQLWTDKKSSSIKRIIWFCFQIYVTFVILKDLSAVELQMS